MPAYLVVALHGVRLLLQTCGFQQRVRAEPLAHVHHGLRQGGLLALVRGVVEQRGLYFLGGYQVRQRYVHAADGKPRRHAGAVDLQHGVGQRVHGVGGFGQLCRPARAGGRAAERPALLPRLVGEIAGRIPHVHACHLGA